MFQDTCAALVSSRLCLACGQPDHGAASCDTATNQEWFWTPEWQAAEWRLDVDLGAGDFENFDTMEVFWLV